MEENFSKYGLGVIPLTPEKEEELNRQGKLLHEELKKNWVVPLAAVTQVDLSPQFPPIRNQGSAGTCVAFATASILDYWDGKLSGRGSSTSVRSPLHLYHPNSVDMGMEITQAARNASDRGCCAEVERPFPATGYSAPITQKQAMSGLFAKGHPTLVKPFSSTGSTTITGIKDLLSQGIPLLADIRVYDSFDKPVNGIVTPKTDDPARGKHAIVIVGFDDSTGMFKFRNSWGTTYGIGGYGFVRYNDIFTYAGSAFYYSPSYDFVPYSLGNNLVTPFIAPSDTSIVALGEFPKQDYRFIKLTATRSGVHTFRANETRYKLTVMSENYETTITPETIQQVKATLSAGQIVYIQVLNSSSLSKNDGTVTVSFGN